MILPMDAANVRELYVARFRDRVVSDAQIVTGKQIGIGLFTTMIEAIADEVFEALTHVPTECPCCGAKGRDRYNFCVYCGE